MTTQWAEATMWRIPPGKRVLLLRGPRRPAHCRRPPPLARRRPCLLTPSPYGTREAPSSHHPRDRRPSTIPSRRLSRASSAASIPASRRPPRRSPASTCHTGKRPVATTLYPGRLPQLRRLAPPRVLASSRVRPCAAARSSSPFRAGSRRQEERDGDGQYQCGLYAKVEQWTRAEARLRWW